MTTQKTIQEAIQDGLQAMTDFDDADVTINDWDVLDQGIGASPYCIIQNADDWASEQQTMTATGTWNIPVDLVVKVDIQTWSTALNAFRDTLDNIITAVNSTTGTIRSAGNTAGVDIKRVRPAGGIGYIYDRYIPPEQQNEATPAFVYQTLIFETELF